MSVTRFNSRDPCGSRQRRVRCIYSFGLFQLTRPVRVATGTWMNEQTYNEVSTHATRAGRDIDQQSQNAHYLSFNSRDPCGSRPLPSIRLYERDMFQLTRPVRVATACPTIKNSRLLVSTHATRAGRDWCHC